MVDSAEFIDAFEIPSNTEFDGTVVGGISAITFDSKRSVYYLLSDAVDTIRFYTAIIDLSVVGETSEPDDVVTITAVTFMTRSDGSDFASGDVDPEGFAYNAKFDTLVMASERNPEGIFEFFIDGKMKRYYNIPDYYLATDSGSFGTRDNLGLEGLSLTPSCRRAWAANENALIQDGPVSSTTSTSPTRIVEFNTRTGMPAGTEYIYITDENPVTPIPEDAFQVNGITEIVALNNKGTNFLVLERGFGVGFTDSRGYDIRVYEAAVTDSTMNVAGVDIGSMLGESKAVSKNLLFEAFLFYPNDLPVDNVEGLSLVYDDYGKSATLIIVADDNFSAFGPQGNQFAFLKLYFA